MASSKIYYEIPDGYLINYLLKHQISDEKRYIFQELNNVSLKRIMDSCYGITGYSCLGTDGCYYCTIIDFVKDGMRSLINCEPPPCKILNRGNRTCSFLSCEHCHTDCDIHYDLL